MTVLLPDTNVLVDALNGKHDRRNWLRELVLQGYGIACCAVTLTEVYAGMRPHEADKTDEFLSPFAWYDISRAVARRAGRLRFEWSARGVTLALADTLIAATALEYGLKLVTRNRKHFPMPELSFYPLPEEKS